jgi:VanZ family protein
MTLLRSLLTDDRWLTSRRRGLTAIWIVLAIITHIPIPQSAPDVRNIDKVIHLIAYFPLGLLLPTCQVRGCQRGAICLLIIALYGICDELLQIPVGRTASVFDWLADVAGASLGLAMTTRLFPR